MTEFPPQGSEGRLYLNGVLQIETAYQALRRHKFGSKAMGITEAMLRVAQLNQDEASPHSIYVYDADMRHDTISALEQDMRDEPREDTERYVRASELLSILQQDNSSNN